MSDVCKCLHILYIFTLINVFFAATAFILFGSVRIITLLDPTLRKDMTDQKLLAQNIFHNDVQNKRHLLTKPSIISRTWRNGLILFLVLI